MFSFWDYLGGTLYVPREKEDRKLGLTHEEHNEYRSVWALYVLPFKKAARVAASAILPRPHPGTSLEPGPTTPEIPPIPDGNGGR